RDVEDEGRLAGRRRHREGWPVDAHRHSRRPGAAALARGRVGQAAAGDARQGRRAEGRAAEMKNQLQLIWGGMLFGALSFLAIAWFVGPSMRSQPMPDAVIWTLLGATLACSVLSRALPPKVNSTPDAKTIVGIALADAGTLVSIVAWML